MASDIASLSAVIGYLVPMVLFLVWFGLLGCAVTSQVMQKSPGASAQWNALLNLFMALSIGIAVEIAVLFAMGIVGLFTPMWLGAVHTVLLIASVIVIVRAGNWPRGMEPGIFAAAAFLLFVLLSLTFKAVRPPGAWDDTMYHLPLARSYVTNSGIALEPFIRFPLSPQNGDLLLGAALALRGGDVLPQLLAVLPLFVVAVGILGYCRIVAGTYLPGYFATAIMLNIPFVQNELGYAYIDNDLALFTWAALVTIALWERVDDRSLALLAFAGMFAGTAAGVKLFGGAFAAILLGYVVFTSRKWRDAVVFAGVTALFGSWWYLRSFVVSGDPFHPVGGAVFGYFLWNHADLMNQVAEQNSFGTPKSLLYLLTAFIHAKIGIWLLAIPGVVVLRKYGRDFRAIGWCFGLYFLFWFFVTQVDRYLSPILAAGSILTGFVAYVAFSKVCATVGRGKWRPTIEAMVVVTLLLVSSMKAVSALRKAGRSLMEAPTALQARPGYELFRRASARRAQDGPRLVQLGFENAIYFYDGQVVGDWFGPGRYDEMKDCAKVFLADRPDCQIKDPAYMRHVLLKFKSRMLAVNSSRVRVDDLAYAKYFDVVARDRHGTLYSLKAN